MANLNRQLQTLALEFSDWWDARGKKLDAANEVREPLYHYTNMAGLLGILSSEEIWLTDIFHLNDPSELGYGINMARDILEAEAKRHRNEQVDNFCRFATHVLVKAGGEIFGFYVASFSREDNDLGQWRAYADNGRGVAIGLSPTLFAVAADQSRLGPAEKTIVTNVTYERTTCLRNFGEAIQRAVAILARGQRHGASTADRKEFGEELGRRLAVPMFHHAISCKHTAYEHERETRLFLVNDRSVLDPIAKFRTRGSNLVPYLASPLRVRSPGAITKIMIGPAADELAEHAVQAFLRRHGLSPDIVEKSGIPYAAL
jgi:Protein of unknown function (DUF2971)